MNKKINTLAIILISIANSAFSQDFNVVPKVKAFETGIRFSPHSTFGIGKTGWSAQFDVAWQVSGFKNLRAAYISIPMGYGQFSGADDGSSIQAKMLHYGWTIRHNLSKEKKYIPFLSYSLLLNQMWLEGVNGHTIGHETRFDFGYDIKPEARKLAFILKIEYSHMTFPGLGNEDSDRVEVFSLKTGLRF